MHLCDRRAVCPRIWGGQLRGEFLPFSSAYSHECDDDGGFGEEGADDGEARRQQHIHGSCSLVFWITDVLHMLSEAMGSAGRYKRRTHHGKDLVSIQ